MTYTSFDGRGGRGGGWQTKEVRGGLSDEERARLESQVVTTFAWPVEIPQFVTPQTSLPRRLVHAPVPGYGSAYWHTVPAGVDGTGRPGNVFVHIVLDRAPETAEPPFRPTDLAGSGQWLRPFGQEQVLATDLCAVRDLPWSSPGAASLLDDLVDPDRMTLLAVLLDAVRAALAGGRPVVLAVTDAGSELRWISAISRLMSPGTSRRFHWSTSERASGLRAAWRRGLKLAVIPVADLVADIDTAGAVVVRDDRVPALGSLDGVPHEGACSPPIPVTPWSVLAGVVLQDRDTAERGLAAMDRVAAEIDDRELDPALPMAIAARLLAIPDTDEADAVLRLIPPSRLPERLRSVVHAPVLRAIGGPGPAAAYDYARQVSDTPEGMVAAEIYLLRAVADPGWLRGPGGAPIPPVTGPELIPAVRRIVEEAHARNTPGDPAAEPDADMRTAADVLRILDLLVRSDLCPGGGHAEDVTGEKCRILVERSVAPLLLDRVCGPMFVASVGPLAERTQAHFVRPSLQGLVYEAGMTGDLLAPSVLGWLYPVPPTPAVRNSGEEPDPLIVELATQVTATVADPSAFRPFALWGLVQRAARGEDVAAAERRLLVPELWTTRSVTESLGIVSLDRLAPIVLDVVLNRVPDRDVFDLVERLHQGPWAESTETGRHALLAARLRRRVRQAIWHSGDATRDAEQLLEAIDSLAERFPVTAPDLLTGVLVATALSSVSGSQEVEVGPGLARILILAAERGLVGAAAVAVEGCVEAGLVDDVTVGVFAVLAAPSAPWSQQPVAPSGRLGILARLPLPPDAPPFSLLDQVVWIRRQRARLRQTFVRDVSHQLVDAVHTWDLAEDTRRAWADELTEFVPRWFAQLGGPEEPTGRFAGLRRALGRPGLVDEAGRAGAESTTTPRRGPGEG